MFGGALFASNYLLMDSASDTLLLLLFSIIKSPDTLLLLLLYIIKWSSSLPCFQFIILSYIYQLLDLLRTLPLFANFYHHIINIINIVIIVNYKSLLFIITFKCNDRSLKLLMFVQPTLALKGYIAQKVMNVMNPLAGGF